jgi:thioredoxin reductase (NADPH)
MESNVADVRNVIVLGSGPAGYTAALYAARADLEPLVLTGLDAGGQLMLTTDVENYPGFPGSILGPELVDAMEKQASRFGAEMLHQTATRVDLSERPFGIWSGDQEWRGRTLIIATGATAKWLGIPGEERLRGRGVSACATCDGFFFRERELIVVGGGDTAMEESTYLTKFASKVTIVHRRDEFRASKIMQDRSLANPKIDVLWDTVVEEILGKGAVSAVRLRNVKSDLVTELPTEGVFVAIGHSPNTSLVEGQVELTEDRYIVVEEPTTRTTVPGVFAAGDVTDRLYRQAVTAAGQGSKAAIDAERFLQEEAHARHGGESGASEERSTQGTLAGATRPHRGGTNVG